MDPLVIVLLVAAWGARLTFNFARKGGYTGMEDYRWAILRSRMSPAMFQVSRSTRSVRRRPWHPVPVSSAVH